jgi:uncharacterized protein (DUF2235 family)
MRQNLILGGYGGTAGRRVLYYDPGVGTLPEPGMLTRVGKKASEWIDLAFARGLTKRVEKAYSYLMDIWEHCLKFSV